MHKTIKTDSSTREFKVVLSEVPACTYLVTPDRVLQAGSGLDALLAIEEVNDSGTHDRKRFQTKLIYGFSGETEYSLGDFKVRVGRVRAGANIGNYVFVQLEYVPCSSLEAANSILLELFQNLVASSGGLSQAFQTPRGTTGLFASGPPDLRSIHAPTPPTPAPQYPRHNLPDYYTFKHLALQYKDLVLSLAQSRSSSSSSSSSSQQASGSSKTK